MPTQHHAATLPPDQWQQLQSAVGRFEAERAAGLDRSVAEYAIGTGEFRRILLVELLHAEIEHRLRSGRPAELSTLVSRYTEITQEDIPALALTEYRIRREVEPLLDDDTFLSQYPDHTDTLRKLILQERGADTLHVGGAPAAPAPQTLGHWQLKRELGRGGMGVVYEARDTRLNRTAAVKLLRNPGSPQQASRFLQEAESIARLRHPNIVQIYELGEQAGLHFLVLEYLPGGSLAERIAVAPLPPHDAAMLGRTIARATAAAHAGGILHRDIKPSNVLLDIDGTPKLSDFGLAKLVETEAGNTETGVILGTPGYMAPEQSLGRIGPAADVYGIGALLYEALTGRPPFRAASALETLMLTRERDPVPPRRLQPGVPKDLETIVLKCLRKSPDERYASADALADDLQFFLEGKPILARPVGTVERARKLLARNPVPAMLGGVIAIAAAALVVLSIRYTVDLKKERDLARLATTQAEASDAQARREADTARERTREAIAERERAEASYKAARASLDDYRKLREDPRLAEGELESLRRELLQAEAGFYTAFTNVKGDGQAFRAEQAVALNELARVLLNLGDFEGSMKAADRALTLFSELSAAQPDRDEFVFYAIYLRELQAALLSRTGKAAESERVLQALLPEALAANERWPDRPDHMHRLAGIYHGLGAARRRAGDPRTAVDLHQRGAVILQQLAKQHPDREAFMVDRLSIAISLAKAQYVMRDFAATRATLQAAIADGQGAAAKVRRDPRVAAMLGECQQELAAVLLDAMNFEEAEPLVRDAVASFQGLVRRYPLRQSYQSALTYGLIQQSRLQVEQNKISEANETINLVLSHARALQALNPQSLKYATFEAKALTSQARLTDPGSPDHLALLEQNIPMVQALIGKFPDSKELKNYLADLIRNRAGWHKKRHDFNAMLADAETSLELDSSWQRKSSLVLRAYAWGQLGRHREAAREIGELTQGESRLDPFQAAMLFSSFANGAENDATLSESERATLIESYVTQAIENLRAADQSKYFANPARLKTLRESPDFAAVRTRPEIAHLINEPGK